MKSLKFSMAVTGNDMADFRIHEKGPVIPTTKEKKVLKRDFMRFSADGC